MRRATRLGLGLGLLVLAGCSSSNPAAKPVPVVSSANSSANLDTPRAHDFHWCASMSKAWADLFTGQIKPFEDEADRYTGTNYASLTAAMEKTRTTVVADIAPVQDPGVVSGWTAFEQELAAAEAVVKTSKPAAIEAEIGKLKDAGATGLASCQTLLLSG